MTDKELNSIGQWLNNKGYDLDLTDCFWMEDWIANETKFRDIAELLLDYHKEQLLIHSVVGSLPTEEQIDDKVSRVAASTWGDYGAGYIDGTRNGASWVVDVVKGEDK